VTTTGDAEGDVIERHRIGRYADHLSMVLQKLRGSIEQTPPMHSAIKQGGTPLYKLARKGVSVRREPRCVHIYDLSVTAIREDELDLHVSCSKGTYIRTLGDEIGRNLGCGATVKRLRRVSVGPFTLSDAVTLDTIEANRAVAIRPVDAALMHLPLIEVGADAASRLRKGQTVPHAALGISAGPVRVYDGAAGTFLGLCDLGTSGLTPVRLTSSEPNP
jgi:tRNA pseudouridine55 synthase